LDIVGRAKGVGWIELKKRKNSHTYIAGEVKRLSEAKLLQISGRRLGAGTSRGKWNSEKGEL